MIEDYYKLTKVSVKYTKVKFSMKEIIYKEKEEKMEYCYLIGKGEIVISRGDQNVSLIGQGTHFGEEEWLTNRNNRIFTMKVKTLKATLYRFEREPFLNLVNDTYPFLSKVFIDNY